MANDKSLISFAVMSVEYGQNQKDYFDMLVPFVLSVLYDNKSSIGSNAISVKKINCQLKEAYGFVLQHNVVEALFRRITHSNYGYLKTNNNNFYYTDKDIDVNDFHIKRIEAVNHQNEVFNCFAEFLKKIPNFPFDEAEMKRKMIIYLNRYGFNVLSAQEVELVLEDTEDIYTHYIGKFISTIKDENTTIFNYIKEIVKGAMLVSAIHLQTDVSNIKPDREFEQLNVFFDTPLLMYALGYSGEELKDATMELINTLEKLGVKMFYFQHNIDELEGILDAYISRYRNNSLDTSYNFEYLISQKFTPAKAEACKIFLKRDLEECHLNFHEYSDDINIDDAIEPLNEYLKSINYRLSSRRKNDSISVVNVYHLRTRRDYKRIENCQYLFITPNVTLCSYVKMYFEKECKRTDYPAIIDDTLLSSIVWLKTAKTSDAIPTLKIISDAVASQMLPRDFWDEFIAQVNSLQEKGQITELEIYRLKYDAFVKNQVYEFTQGDTGKISYENLQQILEITEYERHKELIESNNVKDDIISMQKQEIVKEKVDKYLTKFLSKWKINYYISKSSIWVICFLVVIGTSLLNSIFENIITKITKYGVVIALVSNLFPKVYDKFLSRFISPFEGYFLEKAHRCIEDKIKVKDEEYFEDIMVIVNESKYFKKRYGLKELKN